MDAARAQWPIAGAPLFEFPFPNFEFSPAQILQFRMTADRQTFQNFYPIRISSIYDSPGTINIHLQLCLCQCTKPSRRLVSDPGVPRPLLNMANDIPGPTRTIICMMNTPTVAQTLAIKR